MGYRRPIKSYRRHFSDHLGYIGQHNEPALDSL